jgi:hypothetical protein
MYGIFRKCHRAIASGGKDDRPSGGIFPGNGKPKTAFVALALSLVVYPGVYSESSHVLGL